MQTHPSPFSPGPPHCSGVLLTSCGCCWECDILCAMSTGDTLTKVMDVNSFSYNYQEYDDFHIKYPFRTIIGGESASCVSDRSTYLAKCQGPGKGGGRCNDPESGHVDSDAAVCAVSAWGASAATRPWIVGNFAWVSDYSIAAGQWCTLSTPEPASLEYQNRSAPLPFLWTTLF